VVKIWRETAAETASKLEREERKAASKYDLPFVPSPTLDCLQGFVFEGHVALADALAHILRAKSGPLALLA
jgi:hypothetical protein